jgi:hypothetical protein
MIYAGCAAAGADAGRLCAGDSGERERERERDGGG